MVTICALNTKIKKQTHNLYEIGLKFITTHVPRSSTDHPIDYSFFIRVIYHMCCYYSVFICFAIFTFSVVFFQWSLSGSEIFLFFFSLFSSISDLLQRPVGDNNPPIQSSRIVGGCDFSIPPPYCNSSVSQCTKGE